MDDLVSAISETNWIVGSKFEPCSPNITLIQRRHLITSLDRVFEHKLALVVAPAGFGKSTLLGQWAAAADDTRNIAWLTLDSGDSDPHQLLAYIVLSLAHAGLNVGDLEIGALNGFSDSPIDLVLANLTQALQRSLCKTALVLDDCHATDSGVIIDVVQRLQRATPRDFVIILNSRTQFLTDTASLIASGEAFAITSEQLRFNRSETLEVLGSITSEEDGELIHKQTEGWPVAVQLARVQRQVNPKLSLTALNSGGLVAAYLTDQVLSTIEEDIRDFLFDVSGLEQFNCDLVDAVRQRSDSRIIVNRLTPLIALLVPLDSKDEWYRLHHLFAEYLRKSLKQIDIKRFQNRLIRASEWYMDRGSLIQAVKYAALADDINRCERLILDAGGWRIILTEGIGSLRALLRRIPEKYLDQSPRLMIARAYLLCKDGRQIDARALLTAAVSAQKDLEEVNFKRDFQVIDSMINVYEDSIHWVQQAEKIRIRNQELQDIDALDVGTLMCEQVILDISLGDFSSADGALKSAFSFMRRSGSVLGLNYCYLHAGVIALHRGEMDLAHANINRALELSESNFGSDSGLKHLALSLEYTLRVWMGEASKEDLEPFFNTLNHTIKRDGWVEIYLVGLEAITHLAAQCNRHQLRSEIIDSYHKVAERLDLKRLQDHCFVLSMCTQNYRGELSKTISQNEQLTEWLSHQEIYPQLRNWQSIALGAIINTNGLQHIDILEKAESHTHLIGAELYYLRLMIAKALLFRAMGKIVRGNELLLRAIKIGAKQKINGVFWGDEKLIKALKEVRYQLHPDEGELILTAFISDILMRNTILCGQLSGGLLSIRELEVLEQLAEGKTNKEIARQLELTDNTVKFHLKNIFVKLSVNRRAHAISEGRRLKLID